MATNFFERQDNARRQTFRLLAMFAVAVIAIIVVLYFVAVFGFSAYVQTQDAATTTQAHSQPQSMWQPLILLWVAAGTIIVVGLGSLYKMSELSAGGQQVAAMLGGRRINPQTGDPTERRLLNVVEEMALASGMAVPPVYVMDHESSINAFAAGFHPDDAVVAVSAGALNYLSRDELQGVMAHEFSHILNGDMRLNLRLIGIVYGILVLAVIGYYTMRVAGSSSSGGSKKGGGVAAILFLGMAMMILGYVGVFFGNLIKSAISRQREFLADASAVQFTRNPEGIGGALKKIGGLSQGSRIRDSHAEEVSHMFFSNALTGSFFNLFATHPPLHERIIALDPQFDGKYPKPTPVSSATIRTESSKKSGKKRFPIPMPVLLPVGAAAAGVSGLQSAQVVDQVGQPNEAHLSQAEHLLDEIPQELLDAAREPYVAQAVVFALLLCRDDANVRDAQLELLKCRIPGPLFRYTQKLAPTVAALPPEARLPLVSLTVPAFKSASANLYVQFREVVEELVRSDKKIDLFEYCLRTILFHTLDVHYELKKPTKVRYRSIRMVARPTTLVISLLAYVGHDEIESAERAFHDGMKGVDSHAKLLPQGDCTQDGLDSALAELIQAAPAVKRQVVAAVAACVMADEKVTLEERELLRAVASALECPIPPLAVTSND